MHARRPPLLHLCPSFSLSITSSHPASPAPQHPPLWAAGGGRPPPGDLQTGHSRCTTSYSLACHRGSCGGPEINSLLQRKAFQNCLAEEPGASGPGKPFLVPLNCVPLFQSLTGNACFQPSSTDFEKDCLAGT
uniref:Uncharacterized protein n=1 Tax=Canis lupus familiaris TaxID=9615 RepID=A0A8P0PPJ6_CANLF